MTCRRRSSCAAAGSLRMSTCLMPATWGDPTRLRDPQAGSITPVQAGPANHAADPGASRTLAPELTALRCLFLVAMHHGLQLAPEELPAIEGPDMLRPVLGAMRKAGLKTRVLRDCGWEKAAGLGTAYPALAPRRDGSWVILVHVVPGPDGNQMAAVLDPATEVAGVQLVPREQFLQGWGGTLVLCR